jgi:hypothetical protein
MSVEHDKQEELRKRARAAYEWGRLKVGGLRAALLALLVAVLGARLVGAEAWRWAPLTFVVWTLLWWRGSVLLRSGRYGFAAGLITFLLPLSILRPCCRPGMEGPVCTMPAMCVLAGALVGLPIASFVLRRAHRRPFEAALGMGLGVVSLVTLKCGALFIGEAVGLLGGLGLGIVAASAFNVLAPRGAA